MVVPALVRRFGLGLWPQAVIGWINATTGGVVALLGM